MSGIVGIINLDGRPVDRRLLGEMTGFMVYRGPDAKNIWLSGNVGFGHTMLRSTIEAEYEEQPCSLDGRVWITADARLDGRNELIEKLKSNGRNSLKKATDAELILHSYHVWGEQMVHHLLGDFAFAIWDTSRQRLICARDHFGIKPFYFASVAGSFIFSNTLGCIRYHPEVSNKLNEQAIADFLLCGYNLDLKSNAFADIQRLPPAHTMQVAANTPMKSNRYWKLPVEKLVRYKHAHDYIERFRELFDQAVEDRLRTRRVGILMSGGMDSTSVAAAASRLLSKQFTQFELHACTFIYEHLFKDEERYYSQAAATALGFPISHVTEDDDRSFREWFPYQPITPEPFGVTMIEQSSDQLRRMAAGFRVGLTGQGGDPALHPSPSPLKLKKFFKSLLSEQIAIDIGKYCYTYGRMPRLGIRTNFRQYRGFVKNKLHPGYPPWLNKTLALRLDLPNRWNNLNKDHKPINSVRSQAHWSMTSPLWTTIFEEYDPGVTRFPAELRHPFFDIRLLAFLLALPPVPWCVDKHILRKAMHGMLPDSILCRPKAPLPGFPIYERLQKTVLSDLDYFASTPGLEMFVDVDRFLKIARKPEKLRPEESDLITRPLDLAIWLRRMDKPGKKLKMEGDYESN